MNKIKNKFILAFLALTLSSNLMASQQSNNDIIVDTNTLKSIFKPLFENKKSIAIGTVNMIAMHYICPRLWVSIPVGTGFGIVHDVAKQEFSERLNSKIEDKTNLDEKFFHPNTYNTIINVSTFALPIVAIGCYFKTKFFS